MDEGIVAERNEGDLIFDGENLYLLLKITDDGGVECTTLDGAFRNYSLKGQPFWYIPPNKKKKVLRAIEDVKEAQASLDEMLTGLERL